MARSIKNSYWHNTVLQPTDDVSIFLNYAGGQFPDTTKSNQVDAVVTAKDQLINSISVITVRLTSTQTWDGSKAIRVNPGGVLRFILITIQQDWFGLTLRTELFSDKKQYKVFSGATEGGNVFSTTLSANFKTGGFIFIPEFRIDNTKNAVLFTDKNGAFKKSASSFIIAAIYAF